MKPTCFFIATSWSDSPVSEHFRALARELVGRGHRVVLLIDQGRHDVERHGDNPAVHAWPSPRPTHVNDAWFLGKLIREHHPACLVANFGSVNVMMLVGWLTRVPCRVAWYRTMNRANDIDSTRGAWKREWLRLRKRLVYRFATHVVCNSVASSQDARRVFHVPKEKCAVFHNTLRDPLADPCRDTEGRRMGPWGNRATPWRHRVLCVGRLHPSKGQDVLIRSLHVLKQTVPDVSVEFLGDGPCKPSHVRLATDLGVEDRCRFLGAMPHETVLSRMASSAVTVMPSRSEAFGLVALESLAVGTPVVASAVGGIVEIVTDGQEGFLVPPDDPAQLAARLHAILLNPGLRDAMARNARRRFQAFEQTNAAREQADWFENMAARSR